jgi:hypothetical protein
MFCAGPKLAAGTTEGIVDRIAGASTGEMSETDTLAGNRKIAPTAAVSNAVRHGLTAGTVIVGLEDAEPGQPNHTRAACNIIGPSC